MTRIFKIDNYNLQWDAADPKEFFAICFACYFLYPTDLMDKCPKIFEYIDNYVQNIEKEYEMNKGIEK